VEHARREAAAGRVAKAIASLERLQRPDSRVSRALTELKAEASRVDAVQAETIRRERERAQRAQRLAAAAAQIDDRLEHGDLDAAEQRLTSGEQEFGSLPAWTQLRDRLRDLREQARRDLFAREQLAREQLEEVRPEAETLEREPAPAVGTVRDEPREAPPPAHPNTGVALDSPRRDWSVLGSRGALAGLALLVLMAATWLIFRPVQPVPSTPAAESTELLKNVPAAARPPSPPGVLRPTEPAPLPSARREIYIPASPSVRNRPAAAAENEATPPAAANVEELRARARGQRQAGDYVPALQTVLEGLKLSPNDAGLKGILTALLGDARSTTARSKQEAIDLDAEDKAVDVFARGVRSEGEATRLQRAGRVDAAVRAWWTATDQFRAAAARARQIAAEEANQQARTEPTPRADQGQRPQPPPRPAESRPLPDSVTEQNLVNAALRRYEAAYGSLNAQALREVYPTAPLDQLTREFAGYRSVVLRVEATDYRFLYTDSLWVATVTATVALDITPKSGRPTRAERSQTFQLVKQGNAWVIQQIR
jgi:hypothetical protein